MICNCCHFFYPENWEKGIFPDFKMCKRCNLTVCSGCITENGICKRCYANYIVDEIKKMKTIIPELKIKEDP